MLLAVLAVLALTAASAFADWQWWIIERKIRADFPRVHPISTSDLATWLADPRRARPLLLDVRSASEFSVSHIEGAQRVEPGSAVTNAKLPEVGKSTPIVTYCSVGYRSSAFAEKLRAAGFTKVQNLDGSLFRWANENRPLVNARGELTDKAHPYNSFWGRLLHSEHRAKL